MCLDRKTNLIIWPILWQTFLDRPSYVLYLFAAWSQDVMMGEETLAVGSHE
jgi:hypothetical protein